MLYLMIYLAIGGLFMLGLTIGSVDLQKWIQKTYKETKCDDSFSKMTAGYCSALALIICWLPVVIGGIAIRIHDKFN